MFKITVKIEGMRCGMCEAHINDIIRKSFKIKKVNSSYHQKLTQIITNEGIDEHQLRKVISELGYQVMDISCEEYQKKKILWF